MGNEGELAAAIRWPVEGFREAFAEAFAKGMAKGDFEAGLVWLPNGPKHNPPESPNVVRAWGKFWDDVPECELKLQIYKELKAFTEGLAEGFGKAFLEAFSKGSPNQEQEQEQEHEQESKKARTHSPGDSPSQDMDGLVAQLTGLFTRHRAGVHYPMLPGDYEALETLWRDMTRKHGAEDVRDTILDAAQAYLSATKAKSPSVRGMICGGKEGGGGFDYWWQKSEEAVK